MEPSGSLDVLLKPVMRRLEETVRGDMGLDTLQSRKDRVKLKWWHKLVTLPEDRIVSMEIVHQLHLWLV